MKVSIYLLCLMVLIVLNIISKEELIICITVKYFN